MRIAQRIARGVAGVCLTLATVLFVPGVAWADEPVVEAFIVEGVVVRVDATEVVVDLGRDQGVPPDAVVQFYRRLEVTHSVTGEAMVDRFPIGHTRLSQVGALLSIARDLDAL